jgi:hypothetical protein
MSDIKLNSVPFVTSGLAYGGTPEENVANYMKIQAEKQTIMNNKYGGGYKSYLKTKNKRNKNKISKNKRNKKTNKKYKKTNKKYKLSRFNIIKKRNYKFRGGNSQTIEVPQFNLNELNNSPQNPNNTSVLLNKIYIDNLNNNRYDCYATNTCPKTGGGNMVKMNNSLSKKNKHGLKRTYKYSYGMSMGGCNLCNGNNKIFLGGNKKNCSCLGLGNKIKKLFRY